MSLSYTSLHALRSIVASTVNESGLILIDSTPIIYRYSLDGHYQKHANMKGIQSYPNRYGNSVAITNNGKFGLVCDPSNERVLFLSLEPVKLLSTVPMAKPDVVRFSDDGRFFAIGNVSGRLKVYDSLTYKALDELQLPDGIVCTAFSKDGTKLAISTMDKKVHLFYTHTQKIGYVFRIDDIVEAITFSSDNNKVLGFTRSGSTYVFNIMLRQQFLGDPSMEWPTHIATGFNEYALLLGSRSNQLMIYNRSDGIKLGSVSFEHWGITSVSASSEYVFVGFSNGNNVVINLHEAVQEAHKALESGNIAKLCVLVAESPLVFVNNDLCKQIEKYHETIFCFLPSTSDEKKGYEAIVSLIIADGTIRKELMKTLYDSQEITPFMDNIAQGNAQQACETADSAPLLGHLREFHEIRSTCLNNLMHEIKLLEVDSVKFKEYVESVPDACSECVHELIPSTEILEKNYKKLVSYASANNYASLMEITEKFPILRQTKIYRRLMNHGESLIDKILMMISAGKMHEAEMLATNLTRLKPFASTGNDFKTQIKAFDAFENAAKANNLVKLYALASEHPALRTTEIFRIQIEAHKLNIMTPALVYAKKGDVAKTLEIIAPYAAIGFFEEKNLSLLKKALVHEIELYAPLGEERALLDNYHKCFGWDEDYDQVCLTLGVPPNEHKKLDEVSPECKKLTTFLSGDKKRRNLLAS